MNKQMKSIFSQFLVVLLMVQLIACGGGSSGSTPEPEPQPEPPIAVAGDDQQVKVGEIVHLDARQSQSSQGNLDYRWDLESRPEESNVVIDDAQKLQAYFVVDKPGDYQVKLTVTDQQGQTSSDNLMIVASDENQNAVPIARITAEAQTAGINQKINLSASQSSDADGDTLRFVWSVLSQPNNSNVNLSSNAANDTEFSADQEGSYQIGLKVMDEESSDETSIELVLTNGNQPPTAVAGDDQNVVLGETVLLDGSESSDHETENLLFEWSIANQPSGSVVQLNDSSLEKPSFTPDLVGEYLISLRVSDGELFSEYDQVLIKVEENQAPTAVAGDDLQVETGKTVKLDGGDSFDPEQNELKFEWEFIEKPAGHDTKLHFADTQTPEFDAYLEGRYIVQLIVDDGFQKSLPDTVTIEAKKNHIPVAVIDGDTDQHGQVEQRITLNGGNSYDPEGKALTYQWTLTPVENSNAVLESTNSETASFTPDLPGVYLIKLVVMDDIQESHYDLVRVTVYPAEEMVDVTLIGTLLDFGNNPLEDILVYREGTFDNSATDQNGEFIFDFKVPKSELGSVNLIIADSTRIPRVKLNITDFTEINTSINLGQRNLPRLQRKDLAVWACDEYAGPEDVDINFQLAAPEYEDMVFDFNHTKTFKPRLNTYIQYLPATATIKMSSEAAKVTVGIDDTEWVHEYQVNDDSPDVVIIDVCNK